MAAFDRSDTIVFPPVVPQLRRGGSGTATKAARRRYSGQSSRTILPSKAKGRHMLCQDQFAQEIDQTRACQHCKKMTMTLEAVTPGVFLGGTFARYRCRQCGERFDYGVFPLVN